MTKIFEFTEAYSRNAHNEAAINAFHGGMLPLVVLGYKLLQEITTVCSMDPKELDKVKDQCDKLHDLRVRVRSCKEDFEKGRISLAEHWHTHKHAGKEVAIISSSFNSIVDKVVADFSLQINQEILGRIKLIKETQSDVVEFAESIVE